MIDARYGLVTDRITEITGEQAVGEPFCTYFKKAASFLVMVDEVYKKAVSGSLRTMETEALKELNTALYEDILKENYETSFCA